jgi:hypothetical protein
MDLFWTRRHKLKFDDTSAWRAKLNDEGIAYDGAVTE